MSEAGQTGFETDFWTGFFTPARIPTAIVAKVQEGIAKWGAVLKRENLTLDG